MKANGLCRSSPPTTSGGKKKAYCDLSCTQSRIRFVASVREYLQYDRVSASVFVRKGCLHATGARVAFWCCKARSHVREAIAPFPGLEVMVLLGVSEWRKLSTCTFAGRPETKFSCGRRGVGCSCNHQRPLRNLTENTIRRGKLLYRCLCFSPIGPM